MDALQRIENAEKELAAAKAELAKSEVTYSIGDRFKWSQKQKLILAKMNDTVGLIELDTGGNWGNNHSGVVVDVRSITPKEMGKIWNSNSVTRYWDNRKQKRV